MRCYCTKAFYYRLDNDSLVQKDLVRSYGPVFTNLDDAIEYFEKQGFIRMPFEMYPVTAYQGLVWHGSMKVDERCHAKAYIMTRKFMG